MKLTVSAWNSAPLAVAWRQSLCGSLAAFAGLIVFWQPSTLPPPDATADSSAVRNMPDVRVAASRSTSQPVYLVMPVTPVSAGPRVLNKTEPAPAFVSPAGLRMADGHDFPLVITIPSGPAWRDVFRTYGGAIGVSNSSSARPAYLNHTISPDGRLDEEAVPTNGRFLFRLSEDAINVVNDTLEPAAKIPAGQSAFGVFSASFRREVAQVLEAFCTHEHLSPDDLAVVQLELGPGFGLRVASTTRRAKRF